MLRQNPLPLNEIVRTRDWWTLLGDIPVHGDDIKEKEEGNVRFYFENVDGLSINIRKPVDNHNDKIKYFNTLLS